MDYFQDNYLVSVVVNTYNNELHIIDCLKSITLSTHRNLEIIVVDDASADNTVNLIKNFIFNNNINLLILPHNVGYTKAFNIGLEQCTGDFICFCDGDDIIDPKKISIQLDFLVSNNFHVCGTGIHRISPTGVILNQEIYPYDSADILNETLHSSSMQLCGSSLMLSRKAIDVVGGYSQYMNRTAHEDFEWYLRLSDFFSVYNIQYPLYSYRFNPYSLTRRVHYSIHKHLSFLYALDVYIFGETPTISLYKERLKRVLKYSNYNCRADIYCSTLIQHAINKNFYLVFRDISSIPLSYFFKSRFIFSLMKSLFILFTPLDILLFLKSKFKLSHISNV